MLNGGHLEATGAGVFERNVLLKSGSERGRLTRNTRFGADSELTRRGFD